MMGAPRILQAFARDNVFKRLSFLGRGSGPSRRAAPGHRRDRAREPGRDPARRSRTRSRPIITMFFMVTYGTLNLACFYEGYSRNPSFRPRFRYSHWSLALAGAVGCSIAMLLMDAAVGARGARGDGGLYVAIARIGIRARWGDVHSGVAFERARRALLRLEEEPSTRRTGGRSILALGGGPSGRHQIAEYGYWLTAGRGVLSLGQVISGEIEDRLERRYQAERLLRQFIGEGGPGRVPGRGRRRGSARRREGAAAVPRHRRHAAEHGAARLGRRSASSWSAMPTVLRLTRRLQRNIVIDQAREGARAAGRRRPGEIHIWWHGPPATAR